MHAIHFGSLMFVLLTASLVTLGTHAWVLTETVFGAYRLGANFFYTVSTEKWHGKDSFPLNSNSVRYFRCMTGIYGIVNTINGKVYYGSATRSFKGRWSLHRSLLTRGIHDNCHLQAAWNKYGSDSFEFVVILSCASHECIFYEQMCLDLYWDNGKDCYNISKDATAPMAGRKMSLETRHKMSKSRRGKRRSQEARENMKRAQQQRIKPKRVAQPKQLTNSMYGKPSAIRGIAQKSNSSGHVGVSWDKQRRKWMAYIKDKDIAVNLGRFDTIDEAIQARKNGEAKYFTTK